MDKNLSRSNLVPEKEVVIEELDMVSCVIEGQAACHFRGEVMLRKIVLKAVGIEVLAKVIHIHTKRVRNMSRQN